MNTAKKNIMTKSMILRRIRMKAKKKTVMMKLLRQIMKLTPNFVQSILFFSKSVMR